MKNYFKLNSVIVFLSLLLLSSCNSESEILIEDNYRVVSFDYGNQTGSWENINSAECYKESVMCVISTVALLNALDSHYEYIYVYPGIYDLGLVDVNRAVVISSFKKQQAVLLGTTYLNILSDNVKVEGFKFLNGASPSNGVFAKERFGSLSISGDNVQIVNNHFYQIGLNSTVDDKTGIAIKIQNASNIELSNNLFENSRAIAIKTDDYSRNIVVKFNEFKDSVYFGGAGEVVHIGDANSVSQGISPVADNVSLLFSNNYVKNWNLEKELISIKADFNSIFNNVFEDNSFSAIVVRMGNDNHINNNIIVGNTDFPFRVSGERNIFQNNLACGKGAVASLHAEMVYSEYRPNLFNSYWAAKDNVFKNNAFYGYDKLALLDEGDAVAADYLASYPENNNFLNNIFYSENYFDQNFPNVNLINNRIVSASIKCPF